MVKIIRLVPNCPRPQTTDIGWEAVRRLLGLSPPCRTLTLLNGGCVQSLFKSAIDNYGEPKRDVERPENLQCVRLNLEPCCAVIRPITAKYINLGVEGAQVFNMRSDLSPKFAKVLGKLALFRNGGCQVPCVCSIGSRTWPALFTLPVLMGSLYAQTLRDFIKGQVRSIDAKRGALGKIARLRFF